MSRPESQAIVDHGAIQELTTRAIEQIYPSPAALTEELSSGRRLRAYMGIDPTAPDMHVGHESQLLKLKRLQQLGHEVILLIGDFTGMIGDPTDKSAARVKLTREEVLENAEGYKQQASKIISFDDPENPATLVYNSDWLGQLNFQDVLELASEFTVQQMLERRSFTKRIEDGQPVGLHEFLYPLMQGYDSVALDVDIEVGGSDQIFNMLKGTELLKRHTGKQKYVIAGQLLVDPSGRKIGKTEGNMITLNDAPADMYHKIMLWGDEITPHALELCTEMPMKDIRDIEAQIKSGEMSGLAGKALLARTVITDLHGASAVSGAEQQYRDLTSSGEVRDTDALSVSVVELGQHIVKILTASGLATSKSQARRLLEGNAVKINGEVVDASWTAQPSVDPVVLRVGKRKIENHRLLQLSQEQ